MSTVVTEHIQKNAMRIYYCCYVQKNVTPTEKPCAIFSVICKVVVLQKQKLMWKIFIRLTTLTEQNSIVDISYHWKEHIKRYNVNDNSRYLASNPSYIPPDKPYSHFPCCPVLKIFLFHFSCDIRNTKLSIIIVFNNFYRKLFVFLVVRKKSNVEKSLLFCLESEAPHYDKHCNTIIYHFAINTRLSKAFTAER